MTPSDDTHYLRTQQYRDGTNLNARVRLHTLYSTNPYGWNQWLFDQIEQSLPNDAQIIEFGCGPGWLWRNNLDRIPPGWTITLTDFSQGMVDEVRQNLADHSEQFQFQVVDIQSTPFEDMCFDAAIANHMLYHVPDRPKALAEVRRVLKPDGYFFAATNGMNHLLELTLLMRPFAPDLDIQREFRVDVFSLENGGEQLEAHFERVTRIPYEDSLAVTDAEPIVDYLLSTHMNHLLTDDRIQQIRQTISRTIENESVFRIQKETGLLRTRRT
jgi:ubiquinone/menaquinone biosynthesis C-methylase UbiE